MKKSNQPLLINSIVGINSFYKGNSLVAGSIRIDGDYLGNIESEELIIVSETARIKGNIYCKTAILHGIIFGSIYANTIIILETAIAVINSYADTLLLEEGAILHGMQNINVQNAQENSTKINKSDGSVRTYKQSNRRIIAVKKQHEIAYGKKVHNNNTDMTL